MTGTRVPIEDVVLVLLVTGLALTPWPWLALLGGAAYYAIVWAINERRSAPTPPPPDQEAKP